MINLTKNENIKRTTLYLNVKNPKERMLWEFLEEYGKKNECIRNALYQYMINGDIKYTEKKETLSKSEKDYMLNNFIVE